MESEINSNILKFTYLKDNNTVRELPTTLSSKILLEYYRDQEYVGGLLRGVDVFTDKQKDIVMSSKQARGYVRVPEIGSSRYDSTGLRALNVSRILKIEKVSEVDKSFIDVDLNSCVPALTEGLDYLMLNNKDLLTDVFRLITEEEPPNPVTDYMALVEYIKNHVSVRSTIMSTTYYRFLHTTMISNPQYFPKYTGLPLGMVVSSDSIGAVEDELALPFTSGLDSLASEFGIS